MRARRLHRLLVNPAHGINATLYPKLKFNFMRDIVPVAGLMRVPNVMEINPSIPAKNVAEFIAYAKANPGKINWASSGIGTSVHLSGELFKSMTGIEMTHVPYRGSAPALTDMISGTVHVMFDNMPSSLPHIQGGKLRALGVTTAKRSDALPNVPTVAETVRVTRRARGSAWEHRRTRRRRSSRSSTRRSTWRSPTRRCRRGSPSSAAT